MTATVKTRAGGSAIAAEQFGGGFAGALAIHLAAASLLIGWGYYTRSGNSWGNTISSSSSIQASMVSSLPLPPRQPAHPDSILATETPTPAPVAATPRTVETPRPDAIDIPIKTAKPIPTAEKNTPPPPPHPQTTKVDPTKAQTGESAGLSVPMSTTQTTMGTFSVGVTDSAFGVRFAFYIDQINRDLAKEWNTNMLDVRAGGRRVYITFQIARDGSPSHIKMEKTSGDATLDTTALTALQHIDTFGPLPEAYQGTYVNVQYYFEAPSHP